MPSLSTAEENQMSNRLTDRPADLAAPPLAVTGSCPSFLTVCARPSRMVSLSSMIRIVGMLSRTIVHRPVWPSAVTRRWRHLSTP